MNKLRFAGILIFIFITLLDFGSDIFQAYVYKFNGDNFYFGWTLTFILFPGDTERERKWEFVINLALEQNFEKISPK